MKKVIAFSICVLLGGLAGYFSAPILSMWIAQSSDPDIFAGAMLANYKSSVVCDCNDRSANEVEKELSEYLSALQRFKEKDQKSRVLTQEIGLTYVRLSMVEKKLDQPSRADDEMKYGQAELAALGWKDVSAGHLTSLVAQLNSEYKSIERKDKAVSASATAR
jgi:hypothetical protein